MKHYFDTFSTPCGAFTVAVTDTGAIRATAFGNADVLRTRFEPGQLTRDIFALGCARDQVLEYFAGERRSFDLPLAESGTEFQRRVWVELGRIPYGVTRSYGEIARRLGMTGHGSRAVGRANGRNPIPIVIPCHRVVGADGTLTGYAGGVERKQLLLDLETEARF